METIDKPGRATYSRELWAEIRKQSELGMSSLRASELYGPKAQVIYNRSRQEKWNTPARRKKLQRESGFSGGVAPEETETENLASPKNFNCGLLQPDCNNPSDSPISRFHAALMALVDSPPADFQAAFAGVAQAAIAEGLPEIPAPRSIKELATWFDLWRKAAGLDIKEKSAGITPLVNPMRTVSRRAGSQVIDAEPLPGTPEFEAWEV